jgi:haloalkane dehalogenase
VSKHPERFARLVCMNTSFPGLVVPDDLKPNPNRPARGAWRENSQGIIAQAPSLGEFMRNSPGNGRRLSDEEVRAYAAPFPDQASRVSALAFPRLIPPAPTVIDPTEVAAVLAKWDKPVLLMWGDADGVFPIEVAGEALHRVFKTSNTPLRIEGGTHFVQESAPERLTAEIIAFLDTGARR